MIRMFAMSQYNHMLESWDVCRVDSMEYMFYGSEYNHPPIDSWVFSEFVSTYCMFTDHDIFKLLGLIGCLISFSGIIWNLVSI